MDMPPQDQQQPAAAALPTAAPRRASNHAPVTLWVVLALVLVGAVVVRSMMMRPIRLTAAEFIHDSQTDSAALETRLKDKEVEVNGAATFVSANTSGMPEIRFRINGADLICEFDKDQANVVAKVKPGQTVTMRGKFDGYLELRHCHIL